MTLRLLKSLLVLSVGAWACLTAWTNLAHPESNREFVRHVLTMDSVFPDNPLTSRAIHSPVLHALAFTAIVATEAAVVLLCLVGAARLVRARHDPDTFAARKPLAASGLVLAFVLYFVGFVAVGGEWFCSWQSPTWNGQGKAVMFLACILPVLVVLLIPEEARLNVPTRPGAPRPGGR